MGLNSYPSPVRLWSKWSTNFSSLQARHNLCVVMVEKGLLNEASECLKKVQSLAPDQEYIGKHLAIVENRIKMLSSRSREEKAEEAVP